MTGVTGKKWASILERMGRAFAGAFVAQLALSGLGASGVDDLSNLKKAGLAGAAALLSFVQSMVGGNIGNPATPSLLPKSLDPAEPEPLVIQGAAATLLPMATATPLKALGRRRPSNKPALMFAEHLKTVPAHPITDPAPNLAWPMDNNDQVGCCVVAGLDHALQAIYASLDGHYANWSDSEMLACYQTQNPKFKDWSQGGSSVDGGMDVQTFLAYLVKQGIILGFAKVDHANLDEVKAATYLGLGLVTGEILTSKNMSEAIWDHHKNDPEEGGHCTVTVGYDPLDEQVSWGAVYRMTDAFFEQNVEEAWFIITQAHIDHPAFRAGFDLPSFAAAYTAITGRAFPVDVTPPKPKPSPSPAPSPTPDAGFQAALDAIPGLDPWLAKTAAKHNESVPEYLASLAAKQAHLT